MKDPRSFWVGAVAMTLGLSLLMNAGIIEPHADRLLEALGLAAIIAVVLGRYSKT